MNFNEKQSHSLLPTLCIILGVILGISLTPLNGSSSPKTELWVYTSIYKEFAAPIEKAFEQKYPEIDVQIYQGGSEKIQAKIEAELLGKRPQADILLTSDPFWSYNLDQRGLAYQRPNRLTIEINYYSLMVLVVNKKLPLSQRPSAFADLTRQDFQGLVQFGSPLESGTAFSSVAYLSNKYGWDYFEKLKKNRLASMGGNSTVIQKVESGEKKIGIVLLENAIAAIKRGSPLEVVYPKDGAIPIPSVQVILKDSPHKPAAENFADFILSLEGQKLLRNGFMYAVHPKVDPPESARPLHEVTQNSTLWTPKRIQETGTRSKEIKKKFAELILD